MILTGLASFLTIYFNQDWEDDDASWQDAVARFARETFYFTDYVEALGESSIVLVTNCTDDPNFLLAFGCYYAPPDMTDGEWLRLVRDLVADELAAVGKLPGNLVRNVLTSLSQLGMEPSVPPSEAALDRARAFGSTAPLEEVTTLLGLVSLVVRPSSPIDAATRSWLEDIRTTIATPAAYRWPPTAKRL